jgi:ABC-type transport system involved in multi-copper enzyme maturation permease subunit
MIAVVRSEWIKLRTTSIPWVLTGISLVITGLLILVYFLNHGANGGPGSGGPGGLAGGFGPPDPNVPHTVQQLRDLIGRGIEGYLFAMLLGVLIITVEFRHKTVTTSFLVTPRRSEFVIGKLIMAALAGAGLAVVLLVATVAGGGIALSADGGSFSAMADQIGAVAPGMILVFVLFALLGVGVGSLITNQVAALIVTLGWFLILENIIEGIWNGTAKWLPSGAAAAAANVSGGRNADIGLFNWWQGSLLILAYGLVFAVVGSAVLAKRDIT